MAPRAPRASGLAVLAFGVGLGFAVPRLDGVRSPAPAARELLAKHSEMPTFCGSPKAAPSSSVGREAHHTFAGQLLKELSAHNIRTATAAGVVAALVMAVLSAVVDPLKDRVLRRRVYAGQKPHQMRCFLAVSFWVQMIKFPLFEPLLAWALATKLVSFTSPLLRAALAAAVFAAATFPFTNFRMAASNRSYRNRSGQLKSFVPTLARDMVYAVARVALPALAAAQCSSGTVLFWSVFGACILAAPFNELRDYSLANRKASEFFLPLKGVVFAVLRSVLQAIALVAGYRYAPMVVNKLTATLGHWHSTKVFLAHWKVLPEVELWAVAGMASMAMLLACMLLTQFKRLRRSQPEILRELLLES